MEHKPYPVHSAYDVFYLDICRRLFSIVEELSVEYENTIDLDEEDCRDMAYVLTAYFEDQVNDFGFWKSLVLMHKNLFGKRLPFSDKDFLQAQEEECEDIQPADIHYLAFKTYLNLINDVDEKTLVYFDKEFFRELTIRVFDYLGNIEEVFTTEFYKTYLVPDADYIDFKQKLDWFTFKGYLTGIEFSNRLDDHLLKLVKEKTDTSFMSPLMYAERDCLMFEMPSTYTAFFPVDIFAGALKGSERKKTEIKQLKNRPHGIFHIQQETASHYLFLHTATGEEFKVTKNSFNNTFDSRKEEYWITTVAKWNNEYYISGLCMPSPYKGEKIYHRNIEMQQSFQKHFPAYRQHIEQTAIEYRNKAINFFGADFIVFETGHQLQKRLNEFNDWYFENVTDKSKLSGNSKPAIFYLPKELLNASEISLFIPPADGLQFITRHKQLLQLLQSTETDKISLQEIQEVLPMLFDDGVGPDYWFYLRKHFPLPNLSLFLKCPVKTDEDFEAILRIYLPEEFSPLKLPRFSTFTSERISHKTARDIFNRKK